MAVVQALRMWSDTCYQAFLEGTDNELTAEWFNWFVVEWKVARTIKKGERDAVRRYLNSDFRDQMRRDASADAIDKAAQHLKRSNWSSLAGKNKQPTLPISLVSKVGFFFKPSELVPLDRFSLKGLNDLRRSAGMRNLNIPSYKQYLEAFNKAYRENQTEIQSALREPWIPDLAKNLGCTFETWDNEAVHRKVFDDYLMLSGGYQKRQPDSTT